MGLKIDNNDPCDLICKWLIFIIKIDIIIKRVQKVFGHEEKLATCMIPEDPFVPKML